MAVKDQRDETQKTPEHREARQGERQHVLAVDHDPEFLDFLRVLLQDKRYNVTTTNYVPRTWAQIAALQPSLLLIDLSARSQAGWELLEHLHADGVTSGIPIIVTSTDLRILKLVQQESARYGGSTTIAKPLELNILLDTIRSLIGPA